MNDTLFYFAKVNIAIAVFFLFYRLVFYNDTLWTARRFYLLFAIAISAFYPCISVAQWFEQQSSIPAAIEKYVALPEVIISTNNTSQIHYEDVLIGIYILVVLFFFARMLVQLYSILRLRLKGRNTILQTVPIIKMNTEIAPFSFFHLIFINPALHSDPETEQILAHEKTHARQWHSFDVLLAEILTIACWINPAAWLLKREIRQNLEFLADNKVLQAGFDSKNYQYHLLQLSYQIPDVRLANKFNVLPLKKRIMKMNQQKTSKAGILKYMLIVPVAISLVLSSNAQTPTKKDAPVEKEKTPVVQKAQPAVQKPVKSTIKFVPPVIKKDKADKVYETVEKMPQFPGGDNELLAYISKNIKYPVAAQQSGTQGKIIVRFVINKSGEVENAFICKSEVKDKAEKVVVVGYGNGKESAKPASSDMKLLEKEALRVVNSLPKWTPGEIKGKPVSVYYTLPIKFMLE